MLLADFADFAFAPASRRHQLRQDRAFNDQPSALQRSVTTAPARACAPFQKLKDYPSPATNWYPTQGTVTTYFGLAGLDSIFLRT